MKTSRHHMQAEWARLAYRFIASMPKHYNAWCSNNLLSVARGTMQEPSDICRSRQVCSPLECHVTSLPGLCCEMWCPMYGQPLLGSGHGMGDLQKVSVS
jgi:hypothetical protein